MTRISRVRVWDLPLGGQKLVGPMVHGYKSGLDAKDEALLAGRGLLVAAIVSALVYWVLS